MKYQTPNIGQTVIRNGHSDHVCQIRIDHSDGPEIGVLVWYSTRERFQRGDVWEEVVLKEIPNN